MSDQLTTVQNAQIDLKEVVIQYLSGVQTKSGSKPTTAQFDNFLNFCVANKLNPFKKQAYLVGYDSKNGAVFAEITGINGYRSIAHRTGSYTGRTQTEWGKTQSNDIFAVVTVYRLIKNENRAFTATAFHSESVQTDYNGKANSIWSKRPKGQLDKCAEAAALRMAFPEELGETYIEDEFDNFQASSVASKPEVIEIQATTELTKFIQTEVKSLEALLAIQSQLKTYEERQAFKIKLTELEVCEVETPKTSDGSLMEDSMPPTDV